MKHLIHHSNSHLTLVAIALLVIGLLIRYIIGRRRFNRRTFAGMQRFNNYSTALLSLTIERLLNLVAALMIIAGIFFYLIR